MTVNIHISTMWQVFLVVILVILPSKAYGAALRAFRRRKLAGKEIVSLPEPQVNAPSYDKDTGIPILPSRQQEGDEARELQLYKDLYFKLQNLERYPEILPQSRDLLISLLSETISDTRDGPEPGILSVEQFTPEGLIEFLQIENDKITREWEDYQARRRAGSPVEMFQDQEEAKWWLRQIAPVKYVDGAWLGYINKITTPFSLRRATKDAWQVMSEELGDGDPQKNHVYVYRELMKETGAGLPEADAIEFIQPELDLNEKCVWKAAISQLLISLFPHEFLPEILGFNLHFEGLTMETMKAAKEIEEVGLNPYYFVLHISIDNADSGHTAIAMQAVVKYIKHIQQTQGTSSAQQAWRRVQAGFILSQKLSVGPLSPSRRPPAVNSFPRNVREAEVIRIFKAKAPVAHKIHCSSRMKIGGRKLVDWLEPNAFAGKQWQMDFLDSLSNMKPWVRKGDSNRSKLIQELSWEGKMFGSFTQGEVEVVKRWIDALGRPDPQIYWTFVGRSEITSEEVLHNQDIRVDYPVLKPVSLADLSTGQSSPSLSPLLYLHPSAKNAGKARMAKVFPLWFASPCLLETFVCIPSKTTTAVASSIVRLLRAQYGFDVEGPGVAGMDEVRRIDSAGLLELGLAMMKKDGLSEPASVKDVLEMMPSEFALQMMELSMRPMANSGLLIGLAWAFAGLHDVMTSSKLLTPTSQLVLSQIVRRERDCLEFCYKELKDDQKWCEDFHRGYEMGRVEIESCFDPDIVVEDVFLS